MKQAKYIGAIWGVVGVTLILGSAILRVMPHTATAIHNGLSSLEWIVLVVWSVLMIVAEGYRGFQKQFSPRVAARTWHLFNHGKRIDLILAPLYCIGYFHAAKKRIITAWSVTTGIALVVIIVRYFPQPWRGIIDCGVVLGLAYGLITVCIFSGRTFKNRKYLADPELN